MNRINSEGKYSKKSKYYISRSSNYTGFLEAYFNFAYFLCCSPYRLKRHENGPFELDRRWLQWGITYFLSGVYLFIVGQEFIKSVGNLIQESQHNNTNPLLYLHLVETTTYINLIATVTIIQSSGGTSLLKFVNKVDRISQSTRLCQSGVVTKANFYIYLCVCSTLSVCNYFIFNNFGKIEISGLLQEAYQANSLWIYEINTTVLTNRTDSAKNVFFAGCHLTAIIVRNLRDTYVDLYFLSGIITLWSISKDFKTKSWPIQRHRGSNLLWRQCSLFRKISALSRSHSVAFGYGLCSYMVYQVTYYSLHLDNVFAVKAGLGQRFYYFEFMLAFGLVFVCGAHHLHQMVSLKSITSQGASFQNLNANQSYLINHWCSSSYPAIRAKVFPINFNTMFHFAGQVMVIFLISVQSKVT